MNELNLNLDLNLELSLTILLDTTKAYMEAFEITPSNMDISLDMLKKYQAFERITAYYMDTNNECVSFVTFNFDWDRYELIYRTEDPDLILTRKSIVSQTPKQILEDACKVIKKRVTEIREERKVTKIKMVYTYSDKVWNDKKILEKVREEANLSPCTTKIKFSSKMNGIDTKIVSSLTEKTLSVDYVT